MLHATRRSLIVLSTLALAACGGGDAPADEAEPATESTPAAAPAADPGTAAQSAAPAAQPAAAPAANVLTMGDVERAGFKREKEMNFMSVGAVDGGGGTMGGGNVEVYIYESEVPAARVQEFRQMAVPAFGWNGLCHVGNVLLLYANEAACQALRGLE